jgi:1-acyl-sn-glycerol-3-phosphate acyltransferase
MLYWLAYVVVFTLARLLLRFKVIGREHVPERGGAIIASNHMSYLDIPLLGCALTRRADFVGKSELFKNPIIGFFFRRLGGFPIKREKVDRLAIAEAVKRLQSGRLLVFYPEGRRSENGQLQQAKPGVGMVAAHARVPIIPAFIEGTERVLPKRSKRLRLHPVVIRFGPPIDPSHFDGFEGKGLYLEISRRVMHQIHELQEN